MSALVSTLSASIAWTAWFMVLTILPNGTANYIMSTQRYDEGTFWLLQDLPASLARFGVIALGYIFVAVNLLKCDTIEFVVKVGDLAAQGVWLFQQVLETSSSPVFVALCTAAVVVNTLLWTWSMATGGSRLNRVFVELTFDFLLVVVIPIAMLWLALAQMALDYTAFDIILALYPVCSLQRAACVHTYPVKTLTAKHTIDTLRILTVLDFFTRVGSNLALCRRFNTVVELLKACDSNNKQPSRTSLRLAIKLDRKPDPSAHKIKHCAKILYMLLFAASVIMVAAVATVQSQRVCDPHPECAVHAHRWVGFVTDGDMCKCPRRILVDVNRVPTYEEWLNPKNATTKVAQFAAAGTLEGIQLVNRQMAVFPDELQRCAGSLKFLSLMYTHLTALPPWFKSLTKLEYMYIQGKPGFGSAGVRNLEYIQPDAFDNMPALAFIHPADHAKLPALPSHQALNNLGTLTLVFLKSIQELPGLERLTQLERMVLMRLEQTSELPDLLALRKLRTFHVLDLSVCCNGFITGTCDSSNHVCAHSPCYSGSAASAESTTSTHRILQRFGATICPQIARPGPPAVGNSTSNNGPALMDLFSEERVAMYNGTLYRECLSPDATRKAMCYNSLFMSIWCGSGETAIEVRRREIAAGVSAAYNPAVEAWVGCQAK